MENKQFQPYVPASKVTPELTATSIIMGILLSVIFGAANAYLGLRVGMTVSASIPAAVISMGVIRVIMRKNSILESNLVQTIGSAGESLAAGAIFTMPALFIWASEGVMEKPDLISITLIALLGGLLGVFFMIPLRNALIVREHGTLPYPEGQACAEVLLAGEQGGSNASTVFAGMGFAALFKFIIDGLKFVPGEVALEGSSKNYPGAVGTQIYPAVMSVGYICGPRISSYMFSGGLFSWLVLIPIIVIFGSNIVMYPGTETIGAIFEAEGTYGIWGSYVRYIGAGALAIGATLYLLDSAWGFGSPELGAPQATLMKMVIEGIMGGNLPWGLILIGVFISVGIECVGIPVLPFAIGLYLPVHLNACIMVGGLVRWALEKRKDSEAKKESINRGILFSSGLIAGEGLVGILLALFAIFGLDQKIDLSSKLGLPTWASNVGSLVLFGIIIATLVLFSVKKKAKKEAE